MSDGIPQLLTPEEAAAYLKLPVSSVKRLRQERKITYCSLSPRVFRFTREALDEYLARQTHPSLD